MEGEGRGRVGVGPGNGIFSAESETGDDLILRRPDDIGAGGPTKEGC